MPVPPLPPQHTLDTQRPSSMCCRRLHLASQETAHCGHPASCASPSVDAWRKVGITPELYGRGRMAICEPPVSVLQTYRMTSSIASKCFAAGACLKPYTARLSHSRRPRPPARYSNPADGRTYTSSSNTPFRNAVLMSNYPPQSEPCCHRCDHS